MNPFRIADFQRNPSKFEVPPGKSLPLKAGQTVQARVLGSPGSGIVTLKINDTLVTLKTEIPLPKDSEVYFKVVETDAGKPGSELKLQFAGYVRQQPAAPSQELSPDLGVDRLLMQATKLLADRQEWTEGFPNVIRQILKALPQDVKALPRQTRIELLDILKASLKLAGQNIQENATRLLRQLPEGTEAGDQTNRMLKSLMVHIQKLSDATLRNALENSGVAFEAKLKSFLMNQDGAHGQKVAADSVAPNQEASLPRSTSTTGDGVGAVVKGNAEPTPETDSATLNPKTSAAEPSKLAAQTETEPTASRESIPGEPAGEASPKPPQRSIPLPYRTALDVELPMTEPTAMEPTESDDPAPSMSSKSAAEDKTQQAGTSTVGQKTEGSQPFQKDLKAVLTQLKSLLNEENRELLDNLLGRDAGSAKGAVHERLSLKELVGTIDGLLREVETFQLLSKVTDSFCTFLPIVWDELREGDIAFKKPRGSGNDDSYYCVVNLDLESFGNLMIMVLMQQKDFFVSFKTGDSPLRSLLTKHTRELQQMFEESSIKLKGVSVLGNEDTSLVPFENLEAFDNIISIKV